MGKGFDTFMENPYWRKIYEEAPSENLKEYYRIRFEISPFIMGEDYIDKEAETLLENLPLSRSDIQYIRKHAGSGMARHYYDGAIEKLSGEYEGYAFQASRFQVEIWNPWYNPKLNSVIKVTSSRTLSEFKR